MKKTIVLPQLLYIGTLILLAAWTLLSETETLPTCYINNTPQIAYYINLSCIAASFGSLFVALRLFIIKSIKSKITQSNTSEAFATYLRIASLRIMIISGASFINLLLYYATSFEQTPLLCFFVALIGYFFSWPSKTNFNYVSSAEELVENKNERKTIFKI